MYLLIEYIYVLGRPPDPPAFCSSLLWGFSGNSIRIGKGNTNTRKRKRKHMTNLEIYAICIGNKKQKRNKKETIYVFTS